jgi:hypothetical protein
MTGICHNTQVLLEMGSYKLFCLGWPGTIILPISVSQIARIINMSHQNLAEVLSFKG